MYRCEYCQQLQSAGTPSLLVPVQTRAVTYPKREKVYSPLTSRKPGERRHVRQDERRSDPGGVGFETVREARYCPECARLTRLPV
jgi:hypothetical protein